MDNSNLETDTQKRIGALYSEIKEDADKKDAAKQAEEEALYKAQMARLEAEKAKANADAAASNAEVAKAAVEAKKLDAQEAQTKAAAQEAMDLADFLM